MNSFLASTTSPLLMTECQFSSLAFFVSCLNSYKQWPSAQTGWVFGIFHREQKTKGQDPGKHKGKKQALNIQSHITNSKLK
eukprot:m.60848 g.60848  ORF g.60848 m.60848 type:complete len:81 (-) comp7964_c1_seq2:41-283(-)